MNIFDDISINAGWKAADNHNMSKADFKFALAAIEASLRERGLTQGLLDKPLIEGGGVEITDDMMEAGMKALHSYHKNYGDDLRAAFKAMIATALVKEGVVCPTCRGEGHPVPSAGVCPTCGRSKRHEPGVYSRLLRY